MSGTLTPRAYNSSFTSYASYKPYTKLNWSITTAVTTSLSIVFYNNQQSRVATLALFSSGPYAPGSYFTTSDSGTVDISGDIYSEADYMGFVYSTGAYGYNDKINTASWNATE